MKVNMDEHMKSGEEDTEGGGGGGGGGQLRHSSSVRCHDNDRHFLPLCNGDRKPPSPTFCISTTVRNESYVDADCPNLGVPPGGVARSGRSCRAHDTTPVKAYGSLV